MVINHNLSAMFANRILKFQNKALNSDIEKLSSGQRINSAGDDPANLAVSEKMRSQIRGLNQAVRNIENAVSFIQTTEGYLQESQDILHRVRELSVQAANGVYSKEDRMQIQVEISQLVDEVNRIASHAQFNGMNMLLGDFASDGPLGGIRFQVGANMDQAETAFVGTMTAKALEIETISLTSPDTANLAIGTVDSALQRVSKQRADLGAYQNRFEMAVQGVAIGAENLQAAESQIRDADMAYQMVQFVKDSILVQSGTAMLVQANVKNQSVLSLLG
jgi:flagellin